jgi:phthalate 4,5-dioxygenase oxygenase subunit
MLSREDNELLTRIEGDAPMGRMLRAHWWIPAVPSEKLVADGAPVRTRLFGMNFVAYRSTDGRVGFIDEACPHRGASMALARNEDNALRCIYHGWKFSVDGRTVAVPTQPQNEAEYCKRVPLAHYPVREEGGIVWAWIGEGAAKGAAPPAFQNFPFVGLPTDNVISYRQHVRCNWLQGVETTMDSAHLGVLHQSWLQSSIANAAVNQAPVYHLVPKPYGFRYAAVRSLPDNRAYVRTNSFVLPWYGVISPRRAEDTTRAAVFFSVPIDDENTWYWHISYVTDGKVPYEPYFYPTDPNDWPPAAPGDQTNHWGQDREAMRHGHFTGFPQSLGTEDFAVIESMGRVVDRTKEFLGAGDGAVVQVRRSLLQAVRDFADGKVPAAARHDEIDLHQAHPMSREFEGEAQWKDML